MALEEILKSGSYTLIDVREPMELEMDGEIEGATNIPLGEVEERRGEIERMEGAKVFFCRSGNRSGKAVDFFKNEGRDDVYNGGGFQELAGKL